MGAFAAWYVKASEGGDSLSSLRLGALYKRGARGIAADFNQSYEWYLKAFEAGRFVEEALGIASLYRQENNGFEYDQNRRALWMDRACDKRGKGAINEFARNPSPEGR